MQRSIRESGAFVSSTGKQNSEILTSQRRIVAINVYRFTFAQLTSVHLRADVRNEQNEIEKNVERYVCAENYIRCGN